MEEIIYFDGVPSKVLCLGGILPKDVVDTQSPKMILMIPGFPGQANLYKKLAEELFRKTKTPVWIPAYAGCSLDLATPDFLANKHLYNCFAQVKLFKKIILRYLSRTEIIIVAHSLGAWITLQILEDERCNRIIAKAFLMTPAFERIETFELVKRIRLLTWWIVKFPLVARWTTPMLNWLFPIIYQPFRALDKPRILDYNNVLPIYFLFYDACEKLSDRKNVRLVAKNVKKLKLYYSAIDVWFPAQFCEDLKRDVDDVDAEVDTENFPHDFEIDMYKEAADLITKWIFQVWPENRKIRS